MSMAVEDSLTPETTQRMKLELTQADSPQAKGCEVFLFHDASQAPHVYGGGDSFTPEQSNSSTMSLCIS